MPAYDLFHLTQDCSIGSIVRFEAEDDRSALRFAMEAATAFGAHVFRGSARIGTVAGALPCAVDAHVPGALSELLDAL